MQKEKFNTEMDIVFSEDGRWDKMSMDDYDFVSYFFHDHSEESPAVYVGTYRKYNEGSLFGAWIDLAKCSDYDEFIDVCKILHQDEGDPEFMYQDFEGFPEKWYCESCMDEATFDKIVAYADMDNKEAFEAFVNATGEDDMEMFKERYVGKYESKEDFAYEIVNECFNLDEHGVIGQYFDYKAYAYDLFHEGFTFEDGYVFRDC